MDLRRAYEGVVVCDLSQGIAGPHATMLLAQFGADVIKVEPPDGDWGRQLGDQAGDQCIHSWHYNLGKRSVSIDLKRPDGKKLLDEIVTRSDVFVESFRPGVAQRLGVGYEDIVRLRPNVIYTSMSGFGQHGPYSGRGTVDALMQGFSGLMELNSSCDGVPQRLNMVIVDVLSGLYLYGVITAALARRANSGEGCYLDASMMQSAAAFQGAKIAEHHAFHGQVKAFYAPVGRLSTRDGAVSVSCRRMEHFQALCRVLGHSELAIDPRFAEHEARVANARELMNALSALTSERGTDELLAELQSAGVLVERIQAFGEWLDDRHVLETQAYTWLTCDGFGRLPLPRLPGVAAVEEDSRQARAPHLGQHSIEVLAEMGIDLGRLESLVARGILVDGSSVVRAVHRSVD